MPVKRYAKSPPITHVSEIPSVDVANMPVHMGKEEAIIRQMATIDARIQGKPFEVCLGNLYNLVYEPPAKAHIDREKWHERRKLNAKARFYARMY